jgi:hypothetical protein
VTWLTKELIDAAVPNHTVLRYETDVTCSDDPRNRAGFDAEFADKEWRCRRCCMLDCLDGNAPDGVGVYLGLNFGGNVR